MKNVEEVVSGVPAARVFMQGVPTPRGWAVQYVSGMDDKSEIKPGFFLSKWLASKQGNTLTTDFAFEDVKDLYFRTETDADAISKVLKEHGIETAVVKIGF